MNNMLSEALQEFVGLLGRLFKNLLGRDAELWGNELKKFLRKEPRWEKYFRETAEFSVQIPALTRPTLAELREKFLWIRAENGIERDVSPEGEVTLVLGTLLRLGESSISGQEYERRVALVSRPFLGYQQLNWLVEHQDEHPALMALLGQIYVDGPGLVVVDGDNSDRRFPYLVRYGERWHLYWAWKDYSRPKVVSKYNLLRRYLRHIFGLGEMPCMQ